MKTLVAIGSGKRYYGEAWEHVDGNKEFPHVNPLLDVSLDHYPNDHATLIYVCHFLAYMNRDEALDILTKWKRKMKEGAILRIATPDFFAMSDLYWRGKCDLKDIIGPLYGRWALNGREIYHRTAWDWVELSELLAKVGFKNIEKYDWGKTETANVDDHSQSYLPHMDKTSGTLISLNVQCTK